MIADWTNYTVRSRNEMLLIGLIAILFATPCAVVVLIPFYVARRDSRLYLWIWSSYLLLSLSMIGLFVAHWNYDSNHRQTESNWGSMDGPIRVLGDLSNDLFQLTVLFTTTVLVILFLVSGWGYPKRSASG